MLYSSKSTQCQDLITVNDDWSNTIHIDIVRKILIERDTGGPAGTMAKGRDAALRKCRGYSK